MDGNPGVRRSALLTAVRAILSLTAVLAAYYLLPLDSSFSAGTVAVLVGGVLLVALLIAWQVRTVMRSARPGLRAIAAVATALPFFVLLFAATYYLLGRSAPESFTETLSRTDALYFTMTVFSTVGFGDISPRTELARLLTTGQMTANFLLIGVAARFLLGAVQEGRRLRSLETEGDEQGGPPFTP
ncbi:potassium channel family protein [Streptomyces sp. NBC_00572]|uniref:potassium channel family protein n=1 Tax=Streptomyces sp. NBC_00572 TaxID=2903664 RepID=UPI0022522142|nr:potassium channel family protein [Streptomyces sp. NBC_00572]MCX4980737.1 potassium channel family protein [Streptomyces sp. NBC_00572]